MKYELRDCIGASFRRLSRITDRYYRKHLSGFDITESQLSILFVLSKMGKVEQGKIGKKLELERSTVSRNIRLLESKGLVIRTSDYRPDISLTGKGMSLVDELIPVWEKAMDDLTGILGDEGLNQLSDLKRKLI